LLKNTTFTLLVRRPGRIGSWTSLLGLKIGLIFRVCQSPDVGASLIQLRQNIPAEERSANAAPPNMNWWRAANWVNPPIMFTPPQESLSSSNATPAPVRNHTGQGVGRTRAVQRRLLLTGILLCLAHCIVPGRLAYSSSTMTWLPPTLDGQPTRVKV